MHIVPVCSAHSRRQRTSFHLTLARVLTSEQVAGLVRLQFVCFWSTLVDSTFFLWEIKSKSGNAPRLYTHQQSRAKELCVWNALAFVWNDKFSSSTTTTMRTNVFKWSCSFQFSFNWGILTSSGEEWTCCFLWASVCVCGCVSPFWVPVPFFLFNFLLRLVLKREVPPISAKSREFIFTWLWIMTH